MMCLPRWLAIVAIAVWAISFPFTWFVAFAFGVRRGRTMLNQALERVGSVVRV